MGPEDNEETENVETNTVENDKNEKHLTDVCQASIGEDIRTTKVENDLKLHPKVPPRKHVSSRDKIRDKTLSDPEPDTSNTQPNIPSSDNNESIKDETMQLSHKTEEATNSHEVDAEE